jgi:hypothetical protein
MIQRAGPYEVAAKVPGWDRDHGKDGATGVITDTWAPETAPYFP